MGMKDEPEHGWGTPEGTGGEPDAEDDAPLDPNLPLPRAY
jgi:hypothetical protein